MTTTSNKNLYVFDDIKHKRYSIFWVDKDKFLIPFENIINEYFQNGYNKVIFDYTLPNNKVDFDVLFIGNTESPLSPLYKLGVDLYLKKSTLIDFYESKISKVIPFTIKEKLELENKIKKLEESMSSLEERLSEILRF